MFSTIMAPVDLAHKERLGRALDCAADLARLWGAKVVYVGVTPPSPSTIAHTPEEYAQRLEEFAHSQGAARGITVEAHAEIAHDPTTEVDDALMRAVDATGADLVVMASHIPDVVDYIWPSNGGKLAEHAKCSVMVVRG